MLTVPRFVWLTVLFAVLAGLSVSCAVSPAAREPEETQPEPAVGYQVGMLAPNLELPGITGPDLKLDSLRGRAVLLNFWATWCPPCRAEMPELQGFFAVHSGRADLVLVNVGETKADVVRFMDAEEYTMPVVSISPDSAAKNYGVTGIPTTVLIDADGVIRWRRVGAVDVRTLLDAISALED